MTVSFSCGGWFQMYFFGVALALRDSGVLERWKSEGRRVRFVGVSAGSLAAVTLATGMNNFLEFKEACSEKAIDFRSSIFHLLRMRGYLHDALETFGEGLKLLDTDPQLQQLLQSGVLEIGITVLPRFESRLIDRFWSYEQLRETVLASCCLVPLVGVPFKMKSTGEWATDGGISNFTPRIHEKNTISISPMHFQMASVRPRVFIPAWWGIRPPDTVKYNNLFWMGYNDMIDFLVSQGHLGAQEGSKLLKPEVDFRVHDGVLDFLFTLLMEVSLLIWIRPVVVGCVYVELALSMLWYTVKGVLMMDRTSFEKLYESFRNAVSLRTLGRLLFGSKVPNNEDRLCRRSKVFRMFDPLVLGGNKTTGRECWSPSGMPLAGRVPQLSPIAQRTADFSNKRMAFS